MTTNKIDLTAAEIGVLWTSYLYDSMTLQVIRFMKEKVEDSEVESVINEALMIAKTHVQKIESLFTEESIPIPHGFSEKDVEKSAPDLFTDTFKLTYLVHTGRVGMIIQTSNLAVSARKDIRDYFQSCLERVIKLYQLSTDVALQKGLYLRRPYIPYPKQVSYILNNDYLSGINPFKKHRMLNAIEITHLSLNIETNQVGVMLSSAFMQTAQSEDVKNFMKRGKDISKKHIDILSDTLLKDDVQAPISPNHAVTDATTPVFSDKLMMFHMSILTGAGTGNYATAAGASQRTDLIANYERMSVEVAQFAKSAADIMIKYRWLEEPPAPPNREQLGNNK
ncbi:DUF3231 family protein [Bacillus weihaiensis]|uniref:DUF3231 family protein n=1 Tax=Bacillus weihaiensis TaxID=1547283 RepID=UPI00235626A9|nr:DUF3231 family protein [Bacillus weihaiensis]